MKWIDGPLPVLEMTRGDLLNLLFQLDNDGTPCALATPCGSVVVRVTEDPSLRVVKD